MYKTISWKKVVKRWKEKPAGNWTKLVLISCLRVNFKILIVKNTLISISVSTAYEISYFGFLSSNADYCHLYLLANCRSWLEKKDTTVYEPVYGIKIKENK